MHALRALFPAEALHAAGDGAGGDQNHFLAVAAQGADLAGPVVDCGEVEAGPVVGDQRRAHFDDQALGLGEAGLVHASSSRSSSLSISASVWAAASAASSSGTSSGMASFSSASC